MDELYFKYENEHKPQKGCLLVSEPHLPDSNFERSVILLCEHNEKGSLGFVLNHLAKFTLSDIMPNTTKINVPIRIGGPVEYNTLHFLHRNNSSLEMSTLVSDTINWGGNYELAFEWLNKGTASKDDFLFLVGYSGWSAGQLEEEIERKSWIVFPEANEELVFNTSSNNLWKEVLYKMGGRFSVFANYPSDPRLN